jgi:hypothetical protein
MHASAAPTRSSAAVRLAYSASSLPSVAAARRSSCVARCQSSAHALAASSALGADGV